MNSIIRNTPAYTHDCEKCDFLGYDGWTDFYACGGVNVIARYSSDPQDYLSGIELITTYSDLATAFGLGVARGLINLEEVTARLDLSSVVTR